jgi:hypothetical protein
LIWLQLAAVAVNPVGTDGGLVSGHAGVEALAGELWALWFPALSIANTAYEYVDDAANPVSDVEVAGTNTCFRYAPFLYTLYPFKPEPAVSVDALHDRLIWLQLAAVAVNPVGTDGGLVSAPPPV